MALFEGYDRRIDHINAVLKEYGINGIEDAKAICAAKGIDPMPPAKGDAADLLRKRGMGLRGRRGDRP